MNLEAGIILSWVIETSVGPLGMWSEGLTESRFSKLLLSALCLMTLAVASELGVCFELPGDW
jgi:hypothetical protein